MRHLVDPDVVVGGVRVEEDHRWARLARPLPVERPRDRRSGHRPALLKWLLPKLLTNPVKLGAPVYIRVFKLESELELWVEKDGRFERFATYPICLWSGRLGPKLRQGDRQVPEGVYRIEAFNPDSRYHLSLRLDYPNDFDRARAIGERSTRG